jgi:hypothetical protein
MVHQKHVQPERGAQQDERDRDEGGVTSTRTRTSRHLFVRFCEHVVRLVSRARWRAAVVVLLLFAAGFLEGAGLLLLVPLLGASASM